MAKSPPETTEARALREVDEEDQKVLDSLQQEAGPPPDSEQLSDADIDHAWAMTDPAVDRDPDGFARKLMTTGLSQQELPMLRVLKMHPEWAPLYGQPTQSAELADQYTRMARYPYRWVVLQDIADPEEQVREAERFDRRFQKAHADKTATAAPMMDEPPAAPAPAPAPPVPPPMDGGAAAMPPGPPGPSPAPVPMPSIGG